MSAPRGRPPGGRKLCEADVIEAAFGLLSDGDPRALTLRALATRLGVTPMSLYHHVNDRASLLRRMADTVHAGVLDGDDAAAAPTARVRRLLLAYVDMASRQPALTLALMGEPRALEGFARRISEHLAGLLSALTTDATAWCDILVDHAHGHCLAIAMATSAESRPGMPDYEAALERLVAALADRERRDAG